MSAQAAGGPHRIAVMKTIVYVWTVLVPFTVSDFARRVDKNVVERPFHALLLSCESARHCLVKILTRD